MKAESIGKNLTSGFSTLEILLALAILVLTIAAVILVIFGNQSVTIDSQTNTEALNKAQELVESAQAAARKDFNLVNPTSTAEGIYQNKTDVQILPDLLTKKITATVSWTGEHQRSLSVQLSTLVANLENVNSPNTCSSIPTGDWANAQISPPINVGDSSSGNPVTDVDVFEKKLYATVNNSHGNNDDTLYIFDLSADPKNPTLLGSIDTSPPSVTPGLLAVQVAKAPATGKEYAYLANAYGPNFSTCIQGNNCAELQVVDVTDPATPSLAANFKIPGVRGNQTFGKSLFYKDGVVYEGLAATGSGNGPEFNIIDVGGGGTAGASPTNPRYLGGYSLGSGVEAIYVRGHYAYTATDDNTRELTIFDVSNLSAPVPVGKYDAPGGGGFGYGNSIAMVGDTVYLGRTFISGQPELYILNAANPSSTLPPPLGTREIGSSVNGLLVRSNYAFVVTTGGQFQIYDISNPGSIPAAVRTIDLPGNGATGTSTDCEGNYIYVASYRTSNNKGVISVIYPNP